MVQKKNSLRNTNFDILRIMACIFVVLAHASALEIERVAAPEARWAVSHIYNSIGHTGTILFLFLSGALLLSEDYHFQPKKFYTGNFLKLFVCYYSWIVIYHIIGLVRRGQYGYIYIKDVIINVIRGEASYHFWYLPMLLGLYLILPLLRAMCQASKRLVVYFVTLFLIVQVVFYTIRLFEFPHKYLWVSLMTRIPFTMVDHYVGYFVLGYLLAWVIKEGYIRYSALAGVVLTVAGVLLGLLGDIIVSRQQGANSLGFNNIFSVTMCMTAVGIFLLINSRTLHMSAGLINVLAELAKLTFGVYMIHPLVQGVYVNLLPNITDLPVILVAPIITVLVFLTSLSISFVLAQIPVVRQWIVFAGKREHYVDVQEETDTDQEKTAA